ncbi:MAG: hypothetical protein M1814_005013 [Vezdaea aestivalis]|nr:MAG: hypothetical protein M1814_005013 [Vezdaea aestivalis]
MTISTTLTGPTIGKTPPVLLQAPSPSLLPSIPPFTVSLHRGFLPLSHPPVSLPPAFARLSTLLSEMPIRTLSGSPGLLATATFGMRVVQSLPDLTDAIEAVKADAPVINALYRDYAFVASAYLLEPCHDRWVRGEEYGVGREILPACIARPMARVAELAGFKPFMEYAGSYALYNYRLEDPERDMEYDNLRLIRAFEHGLDPLSSEAGFVLVHVDMVRHSGLLVSGAVDTIAACADGDRELFDQGLGKVCEAMKKVNRVMDSMWKKSKPRSYTSFRTFIFGITSQSMFPKGVIYEGVSDKPMSFRGESGANDSMIPLCDNLLQIHMPATPLTEILRDFRAYRPGNHREFLEWVAARSKAVKVQQFALEDAGSAALYIRALNQVRDFRWRHWCFTREYILKQTSHPTATGGSPIVTWLPNQLQAVLDLMIRVDDAFGGLGTCADILNLVRSQQHTLSKEVEKYCKERNVH